MQKILKQGNVNLSDNCITIPDVPVRLVPRKVKKEKENSEAELADEELDNEDGAEESLGDGEISDSESDNDDDFDADNSGDEDESVDKQDDDRIIIGGKKIDGEEPKLYKFPTLNEKISEGKEPKSKAPKSKKAEPKKAEPKSEVLESLVEKAICEASRILDDAHTRAQDEINSALAKGQALVQEECEKARQIGYSEGMHCQMENVSECIEKLELAVADIEGRQEDFFARAQQDLKFMALEIAVKIMGDCIERDETTLVPLIKNAISSQRTAKWLTVEISEKAQNLLQTLRSEIEQSDPDKIKFVTSDVPPGTVKIEMPSGFVDASIYTQIENLADYFKYQI